MTNYYALLGIPETLNLDTEVLEDRWRHLTRTRPSASGHESDGGQSDFDLNLARATLLDPVTRLAHWLALRAPAVRIDHTIEPALMDLFAEISPVIKDTDELLSRHRKATTALARAVLTREAIAAQLRIQKLLQRIQPLKTAILERFSFLETEGKLSSFDEATRSLGQLKFLKRWEEQCRERLLSLIDC